MCQIRDWGGEVCRRGPLGSFAQRRLWFESHALGLLDIGGFRSPSGERAWRGSIAMRLASRRTVGLCLLGLAAACSNPAMYDFTTKGLIAPKTDCTVDPRKLGQAEKTPDFREGAGCQVSNAWRLYSLAGVRFTWPAVVNCGMVGPLYHWLTATVQPAARAVYGENVVAIQVVGSYSCRALNRESGAQMSEHGFGNAFDVSGFVLRSGRKITVLHGWNGPERDRDFLRRVHSKACGEFSTVLGPEDRNHRDHFHIDKKVRLEGNYCL